MSGDAGSPLIAVRRCAEAHALTARVRGDVDRGRDWLDILALIDQAECKVAAHDAAIRAAVLREAADAFWPKSEYSGRDVISWLRGRAAALRAAQPTEGHIHECAIPAHRHNDLCICGGCGVRFDGAQPTEGEL